MGMTAAEARPVPLPLPGRWTFWADLYAGPGQFTPAGPVQLSRFFCTRKLSRFGSAEASVLVDTAGLTQADLLNLWGWRLWAYYQGQPYWCGMPDGVADEGGPEAAFTLTELPGYLGKRQWDEVAPRRFEQAEQVAIAAVLAAPAADVGVEVVTEPGQGVARDRTYEFLESESRAQLLTNLSEVIDGPQYRPEYYTGSDGLPRARLRIAYPSVGSDTGLGVRVPGTAVTYSLKWDSDSQRTRTYAVGEVPESSPEGTPKPWRMVDRPQPGLPRLDGVDDWPGVILESTLQERADTSAGLYARPVLDMNIQVTAAEPPLFSYAPGDLVTVAVTDPLLSDGLEFTGHLTEVSVNAREAVVTWTVSVTVPPGQARYTLIRELAALRSLATGIFRRRLAT